MTIRCWGRRYPNAPLQYYTGAQRRLPPHFWSPLFTGFTGEAAGLNGHKTVPPVSVFMGKSVNPELSWAVGSGSFWPVFSYGVSIILFGGVYTFALSVGTDRTLIGGDEEHKTWQVDSVDGWDWGTMAAVTVNLVDTSPGWAWGGDAVQKVWLGSYDLIPANSCSGVFP